MPFFPLEHFLSNRTCYIFIVPPINSSLKAPVQQKESLAITIHLPLQLSFFLLANQWHLVLYADSLLFSAANKSASKIKELSGCTAYAIAPLRDERSQEIQEGLRLAALCQPSKNKVQHPSRVQSPCPQHATHDTWMIHDRERGDVIQASPSLPLILWLQFAFYFTVLLCELIINGSAMLRNHRTSVLWPVSLCMSVCISQSFPSADWGTTNGSVWSERLHEQTALMD